MAVRASSLWKVIWSEVGGESAGRRWPRSRGSVGGSVPCQDVSQISEFSLEAKNLDSFVKSDFKRLANSTFQIRTSCRRNKNSDVGWRVWAEKPLVVDSLWPDALEAWDWNRRTVSLSFLRSWLAWTSLW